MLILELAIAGLGIGAVAALAGLGLLVTHRLTGVFNLAIGAVAMLVAYLNWWLVRQQGWPTWAALLLSVVVAGPCLGLVIDVAVFRSLQRRNAAPAELLAASLGVFVLVVGTAFVVFGGQSRTDAPSVVGEGALQLGPELFVRHITLVQLGVVAAVAVLFGVALRSRFGRTVRAVVDNRDLAELGGIDTVKVGAVGWAVGSFLAGCAGVLLAPALSLDPYGLTLVVLETMAVAIIAGLTRPVVAVAAALAIGIAQSELSQVQLSGPTGQTLQALTTNLFVVVLFLALLMRRRLDEPRGADAGTTATLAVRRDTPPPRGWWIPAIAALAVPLVRPAADLRVALAVPALAIILVSIVVVSGYGGQISLGQAGFAGAGALAAAWLTKGVGPVPPLPGLLAVPLGALVVVPVGLLTSWLAIRRRGLFLALTTFAVGALISRFVFAQPAMVGGLTFAPPAPFGADDAFYVYELACLGGALLLVRNLHRGRLGRALIAVRDNEAGARAAGIDVVRLKIVMFSVSAFLAAFGGALATMAAGAFDAAAFDPVQSLLWFTVVVVFGIDSAAGAVLGAGVLVALDAWLRPGLSTVAVGVAAVSLGRLPGGLLYGLRRLVAWARRSEDHAELVRLSPAGLAVAERLRP